MALFDLVGRLTYDRHGYFCECWMCRLADKYYEWVGRRMVGRAAGSWKKSRWVKKEKPWWWNQVFGRR